MVSRPPFRAGAAGVVPRRHVVTQGRRR